MSFFGNDYNSPRRRVKSESVFTQIRAEGVQRLSDSEPPYAKKVFLTRSVLIDGASGSLPGGLTGHVPAVSGWEKSDRSDWKAKKLCLVTFSGRGTFQVPISALALG